MSYYINAMKFLSIIPLLMILNISCSERPEPGKQVLITEGFSNEVLDAYWLYLPSHYDKSKKWPMILYLQGGDAAASPNPNTVKNGGPINYIHGQKALLPDSFVIVNPHMRTGSREQRQWFKNANSLIQITDQVIGNHNVDPNRVYITGHSRGGHGAWGVVKRFPKKFAAVMPIAGAITCKSNCEKIADVPMWIMHNVGDPVVSYDYPQGVVNFFETELEKSFHKIPNVQIDEREMNAKYLFTTFDSDKHGGGGSKAYSSPMVYEWLLDKKRN